MKNINPFSLTMQSQAVFAMTFFFSFLFSPFCDAQTQKDVNDIVKIRNAGSATRLEGKILVVNFWVKTNKIKGLSKDEKNKIKGLYQRTEKWFQEELKPYKKTVSIEQVDYGFDKDIVLEKIPIMEDAQYDPFDNILRIFEMNEDDFLNEIKSKYTYDNLIFTINLNADGRSFAMDVTTNDDIFLETFILFNSADGYKIYHPEEEFIVPHEFLHMFGAIDLYADGDKDPSVEKLAKKHIGNSIMLGARPDNSNMFTYQLDDFTAYLIGLHQNYDPLYGKLIKNELKKIEEDLKNKK